jgi:hypothetical protein
VSGGETVDEASRSRCLDRTGLRVDHRKAERFGSGKQVASYLGLVPLEDSSGNRRRLGHITKQGSSMIRFLLVEAAQVMVRSVPEWRSNYLHLMMRRGRKTAKVAMARKLAVRLYWMMRKGWDFISSGASSVRDFTPPSDRPAPERRRKSGGISAIVSPFWLVSPNSHRRVPRLSGTIRR